MYNLSRIRLLALFVTYAWSGSLISASTFQSVCEPNLGESALWPEFIEYNGVEAYPNLQETNFIVPSSRGKLIRIEDGNCLVDFGRDGNARIPVNLTDAMAQMRDIKSGAVVKGWGNAAKMILPGMIYVEDDIFKPFQTDTTRLSKDKFLILYCRPNQVALNICISFARAVEKRFKKDDYVIVVLFTELFNEFGVARQLKQNHSKLPFIRNYLSKPLTRSLQHNPKRRVEAVCIDKDGKVLVRSNWLGVFSNRVGFLKGIL